MADMPISERVMSALMEQLETITIANGYHTDLGARTYRARRSIDPAQLPAQSLFEEAEVPNNGRVEQGADVFTTRLGFSVQAFVPCDVAQTGTQLGLAKADIKQCLMGWAKANGGVVDDDGKIGALTYRDSTALPRPEGSRCEAVSVSFEVMYQEAFGDPASTG